MGDIVPVGRATTRVVGEFKRPEPWVDAGRALSLSEVGRKLIIRVGVDFGSGFSKLAVALNDEVYPVDWAGLHGGIDPYLLPGELSLVSDGGLYVGRCLTGISTYDNLKLPFLSGPTPSDNDLIYATSYLAWVFKYARAWVYKYKASVLTNRKLVWVVNVGLPTETWGGTGNLLEKYKTMALAAWRVSQDDGPTESSVLAALNSKYQDASVGLESLSLIPEFVAQVAGYLESPQRVPGMHLLVDVGAGTLDVACFRVMRDNAAGVDRLPVFAASVRLQGTSFLMRRRLKSIGKADQLWNSALPTPRAHVFAAEYACATEQIDQVDGAFSREVMSTISNVILKAKDLDPTADEFKHNETAPLQVILSGGGASIEAYESAVKRACRSVVGDRYDMRALSRVVNLQLTRPMLDSTYSRVSVAVGLTRLVEDFQLIAPKEIPPLEIVHAPRQSQDDLWGG